MTEQKELTFKESIDQAINILQELRNQRKRSTQSSASYFSSSTNIVSETLI